METQLKHVTANAGGLKKNNCKKQFSADPADLLLCAGLDLHQLSLTHKVSYHIKANNPEITSLKKDSRSV